MDHVKLLALLDKKEYQELEMCIKEDYFKKINQEGGKGNTAVIIKKLLKMADNKEVIGIQHNKYIFFKYILLELYDMPAGIPIATSQIESLKTMFTDNLKYINEIEINLEEVHQAVLDSKLNLKNQYKLNNSCIDIRFLDCILKILGNKTIVRHNGSKAGIFYFESEKGQALISPIYSH